jgi:dTDP-4-amino-4,6-dideoxygalactose transaminase
MGKETCWLMKIPFNKPYLTGEEIKLIGEALSDRYLVGDGRFTKSCHKWLESKLNVSKALLTPSCTDAIEMAALMLGIKPGDEIIMPSFTFVSTANPFVLRGAVPVFVDIRKDTLNIDETKIEAAITKKTRAIVVVHYAGIACEMDSINALAKKYQIPVVEDAAHGILAKYDGHYLGSIGDLGTLSFHGTKNIVCGEGGAILINDNELKEKAEIIWEKGTNRSNFFRGLVDKYTWVEVGSSYLPSEITAAFLLAQLNKAEEINQKRLGIWNEYHRGLSDLEDREFLSRPGLAEKCEHNAHLYYLILPDLKSRTSFIKYMREKGIGTAFHYVPLHNSPAGIKFGRSSGDLSLTQNLSDRQVRIPLWPELSAGDVAKILEEIHLFCRGI